MACNVLIHVKIKVGLGIASVLRQTRRDVGCPRYFEFGTAEIMFHAPFPKEWNSDCDVYRTMDITMSANSMRSVYTIFY